MSKGSGWNHQKTTSTAAPGSSSGNGSDSQPFSMDAVMQAFDEAMKERANNNTRPHAPAPPKPSALRVAVLRAAHQLLDKPLVFDDPVAISILGPDWESYLREDPSRLDMFRLKGFRASMAVRSKLAEDKWDKARENGVCQYVVLGAGLDTYAYRNKDQKSFRVFEVDLPDMTKWKRDCLLFAGIPEPENLTFATVDFEHASLSESLKQAGFDANKPAFFSWLGVTFYLEEESIFQTLRIIGSMPKGSGVVFDYAVSSNVLTPTERESMCRLDKKMANSDEPWKTHLDPDTLVKTMRSMGFSVVEDYCSDRINDLYLSSRTDGFRKGGLTRLIHAQV